MNYEFENEYLAKSLISLVQDEGDRIIKSNLATYDDVKSLVQPTLDTAIDNVSIHGSDIVIKTLSTLHNEFSGVKLPGDFKKMAINFKNQFDIILGYSKEEPKEESILDDVCVIDDEYDDSEIILSNFKEKMLQKLSNIIYVLGSNGNHEEAYKIERAIREFESV